MSDKDIANIERTLGVLLERTETQGKQLDSIHADISQIKRTGCAMGSQHELAIADLGTRMGKIEGIGKKVMLAVVGIGVGSVGLKEAITVFLRSLGLAGE